MLYWVYILHIPSTGHFMHCTPYFLIATICIGPGGMLSPGLQLTMHMHRHCLVCEHGFDKSQGSSLLCEQD